MPKAGSIHEKPTSRSVTMACLGGVAFFLARCTHSPTQRVAELYYYFSPHQHSDPILPDGVYLLSTPMGRDGNPRGKIQPALYQPGHHLAKHHFSSKRDECYHKLRSTYFTLRIFFFSPTSTTLTIQLVVTGTLPHLYNATTRMNAGHDRHWSSNGDTADCRWRGEFQHKHTL